MRRNQSNNSSMSEETNTGKEEFIQAEGIIFYRRQNKAKTF